VAKSWQFFSGPGTLLYRLFDRLRQDLNRKIAEYLVRRGLPQGGRILEAGSGPAYATSLLNEDPRVRLAVALDIDLEALQEARLRDPKLPVVVGDLHHLPFAPGAFDLVWNSSTFEHLERRDRILAEMTSVTRPGGRVFVGVPYRQGPLWFQSDIARTGVGIWLGTVFSRHELARILERHHLRPLHTLIYFVRFFVGIMARKGSG
jgi:SAM-dependent methyltransferase